MKKPPTFQGLNQSITKNNDAYYHITVANIALFFKQAFGYFTERIV